MNQLELLADFNDKYKEKFNPELFVRSDDEIMEQLQNLIKSCERNNNYYSIKVLRFQVIDDYSQIRKILKDHYDSLYRKKSKSKKQDNQYDYIDVDKSDMRLLIVTYYISINMENNIVSKQKRDVITEDTFDVYIAVPRIVNKYYIRINGVMRSALYQIVDGSTYNNNYQKSERNPNISFKIIFMAARVYSYFNDILDETSGKTVKLRNYGTVLFNKKVSACNYFLAKYGFYGTLDFLGINDVYVSNKPNPSDKYYSFRKGENLYVISNKYLTDNDFVTQSFIMCILMSIYDGMDYNMVYDNTYWVRIIGARFNNYNMEKCKDMFNGSSNVADTYIKGLSILDSFESIYDISTKKSLRLKEESKHDMYCVLRWIIREFNNLIDKDNYDVSIKRIRFAEYIAAIYIRKIAKGMNRVSDHNNKITIDHLRKAIRTTDPMVLMKQLSKSNLVAYRNMVSDMDSLLALKYTFKGISGIGDENGKNIPESIRYIHPSQIGIVDMDVSQDNDPGISGVISPFLNLQDGGFFTDKVEPDEWEDTYQSLYEEYKQAEGLREVIELKQTLLSIKGDDTYNVAMENAAMLRFALDLYNHATDDKIYRYPIIVEYEE